MKSKIKNFLITLLAFGFLAMFNWICFDGAEKSAKIFNTFSKLFFCVNAPVGQTSTHCPQPTQELF